MFIKLVGLYHLDKDDSKNSAYYQAVGTYCFQFTNNKDNATDLTQDQVNSIIKYKDDYCKQYGASDMVIVSEV